MIKLVWDVRVGIQADKRVFGVIRSAYDRGERVGRGRGEFEGNRGGLVRDRVEEQSVVNDGGVLEWAWRCPWLRWRASWVTLTLKLALRVRTIR